MTNREKLRNKLRKYKKDVLIEYIVRNKFFSFRELDLIKMKLENEETEKLLDKQKELRIKFNQLVEEMNKENNSKQINEIVEKMKATRDELEKVEVKVTRLLLC